MCAMARNVETARGVHARATARCRFVGLAGLGILVAGCQSSFDDMAFSSEEMAAIALPAEIEFSPPFAQSSSQPRLIRNGSARVEVGDLEVALEAAQELAAQVQGFVAGSDLSEGREGSRTASLVLRLPSGAFESVVGRLVELGRVLSVSVQASDVSREYLDVETRLAVKEETVTRLRELAAQGGRLEDLLAAERELGRAVTELESLKGQVRYYDQRIAESDLRLTLVEPGAVITSGAFRPVVEAFRDAINVFAQSVASLVYIVVFLTPWVIAILLVWPLFRRLRRARRERVAARTA